MFFLLQYNYCFNHLHNLLWDFSGLVVSIWCSVCFLCLSVFLSLLSWGHFLYELVEDLAFATNLGFFSLIYAYNSKVWFIFSVCPRFLYAPFLHVCECACVWVCCVFNFSHFFLIYSVSPTLSLILIFYLLFGFCIHKAFLWVI